MKTIIAVLALASCCLSAEVPYPAGSKPQSGLLVLPLRREPVNATNSSTTPRTVTNEKDEGLEGVNAKIMERLRQEQGSVRGVYHVYLQDGRLQRVQYTTAPISTQQQSQQEQASNYNQQGQTPDILSPEFAGRRGVYFVQVPQERVQALQTNGQQKSQVSSSVQLNQEQANQVGVRYLPLQASEAFPGFNAQYNQEQASLPTVRYLPIQLGEDSTQYSQQQQQQEVGQNQFTIPRFNAQQQQQRQETSGFVANVEYSQVEPIQGPVYSYEPQQLTRILRYAAVY